MTTIHKSMSVFILSAAVGVASAQVSDKLPTLPGRVAPAAPTPAAASLQQLGAQTADPKTASEVRSTLADLINAGLTDGKFHNLVMDLARQDRDRIGEMPGESLTDLNKAIAQFRADFKAKYKQDFDFRPEHLKDAIVNIGAEKGTATVILPEPEKTLTPDHAAGAPAPASGVVGIDGTPGKEMPATPSKGETGVAGVVTGPSLHLVQEAKAGDAGVWKVTIPNQITGRQLKENLTSHLLKLDDQKSVWSDDPNVTSRSAASAIVRALTDSTLASDQ